MGTESKATQPSSGCSYHRYEIVGDNSHTTDVQCSNKIVTVRRVPVRGVTLTIGVFFDGTGNNQANSLDLKLAYGNCSGLVGEDRARACEHYESLAKKNFSNSSYQGGLTNISRLHELYTADIDLKDEQTEAQIKAYISGIGTADGESDSMLGMALGSSLIPQFEGVVTKTDNVLAEIIAALKGFIGRNRDEIAIAKIQFDVFGFSRGAASARHFANRVMSQDPMIVDAIQKGLDGSNHHGKPAGEVCFIGLFDTVAAIGSLLNFYDIHGRRNPGVELELRPSVAQKVFQIRAMHECRYNFSLNSIEGMWPELALPGVHSDIGGGYNAPDSALPESEDHLLTMPDVEIVSDDTPETATTVYRKAEAIREKLYALPALKYMLPHGKVETRAISWPIVNRDKARAHIFEKKVGAAVFLKRQAIPNDWEKVSMRVMLDAAQDAGVAFQDIDPTNPNTSLPSELLPLCEKAIEQGRAVRYGKESVSFTQNEMLTIGRYTHCSANWDIDSDHSLWVSPSSGEVFLRRHYAPTKEQSFVWANAPCDGWVRTVWSMDDQQQWEERRKANVDAVDRIFG